MHRALNGGVDDVAEDGAIVDVDDANGDDGGGGEAEGVRRGDVESPVLVAPGRPVDDRIGKKSV